MRRSHITRLLLLVLIAAFAVGWRSPAASLPTGIYNPINMTLADHTLYVSDQASGVHIYNVADPASPQFISRIALNGHRGTAVKDDIVYASTYNSLRVYRREGDTFTYLTALESEYDYDWGNDVVDEGTSFACACRTGSFADTEPTSPPGSSSYATFAVIDDYLYRVDGSKLITYDIGDPAKPKEIGKVSLGWTIETLYPTSEYLFVGGTRGMYVCSRSNPAKPALIGEVQHFRACDPVVVSGQTAFVTLRGGNGCGDTRDALLTIDISDPTKPAVVGEKSLATPFGLAVSEPYLYVSTGANGYALFSVADPKAPAAVGSWAGWPTRDFLWASNVLYVLGEDDVRIFDVTDPTEPVLLATIENDPS
jgi:Uncharacterized conserved protein